MASIGPRVPPHLTKRKRTPGDQGRDSPPAKQIRNTDEVDLDDDSSDDGYGPTVPGAKTTSKPSIGPIFPAQPATSEDSPRGGSDPRATSPKPSTGPSQKRVLGPAPPPADLTTRPSTNPDDESSSDSDYGPALPTSRTSQARRLDADKAAALAAQIPDAPKRDDWMLAPPSDTSYRERDPTKLKNRKFATGRTGGAPDRGGGISSIWTETPEEKRKRLEDAVLGRGTEPETVAAPRREKTRRDEEQERRIREYTDQARGKSLYEEHQTVKKSAKAVVEEEDDPSKRAFDREKDMALGGKIGNAQRRELLTKAKDFGGRFQKGSYL